VRRSIPLLITIALATAACGGGDGDGKKAEYVDAIAATFTNDESLSVSDDDAACLAEDMVDVIGVDRLEDAGVEPAEIAADEDNEEFQKVAEQLSEAEANELVDVIFDGDCVDFGAIMAESILADASGDISDEQATCIGDAFADNEAFKGAFAQSLLSGAEEDPDLDAAMGDIFEIFETCDVSLEDLAGS
jgi:hypothetical protein